MKMEISVGAWKMYPVNRSVSILSEFKENAVETRSETKGRDLEPHV